MTRQSTALLSFSPLYTSSWGDETSWRIAGTCQLVEGSQPYWIVTPTLPAENETTPAEILVQYPDVSSVVQSVLIIMAAWFGDAKVLRYLLETHNVEVDSQGVRKIAPYFELSEEGVAWIAAALRDKVKLALTQLDEMCLLDAEAIESLRRLGFVVTVFAPIQELAVS